MDTDFCGRNQKQESVIIRVICGLFSVLSEYCAACSKLSDVVGAGARPTGCGQTHGWQPPRASSIIQQVGHPTSFWSI